MDIKLAWDFDATLLGTEVDGFEVWTWDAANNTRTKLLGSTAVIPTDAAPFIVRVSLKNTGETTQGTASLGVWAVATDSLGEKFYSATPASMSVAVRPPNVTGLRQL